MHRSIRLLAACAAITASCESIYYEEEHPLEGQAAPKPSATIGEPRELAQGIWSIAIDVDVPTIGQQFVSPGDGQSVISTLLTNYQHAFATELQRALDAVVRRNAHCTISALSIMHAREVWVNGSGQGGPMTLPSGAIVILPCGGNEPLVRPDAATPPMPH